MAISENLDLFFGQVLPKMYKHHKLVLQLLATVVVAVTDSNFVAGSTCQNSSLQPMKHHLKGQCCVSIPKMAFTRLRFILSEHTQSSTRKRFKYSCTTSRQIRRGTG
eukprot:762691-Hanusia_phi.AAC.3